MQLRLATVLVLATLLLAGVPAPTAQATPGDLVARVKVPVPSGSGIGVSIAFDGETFWYTNYQEPTLYGYTIDCPTPPACSSTLVAAHPIHTATGQSVRVDAMAYDGTRGLLWTAGLSDNRVWQVRLSDGVATPAFTVGDCFGSLIDGLGYDGQEDIVYYSPDVTSRLCKFTPTGTFVGSISMWSIPAIGGCGNSGVAVGGSTLYLGTGGCGRIVRMDKTDLSGQAQFASPGGRDEDLECDPVTFAPRSVMWSKDAYDDHVTAFEIPAGSCGIGGLPPCTSDVVATIADPEPGFDYFNGVKTAQDPAQPLPRVTGEITFTVEVSDPARVPAVSFYVDNTLLATDTEAPFAAAWDSTAFPGGTHTVRARFTDSSGCPGEAVSQAFVTFCGLPLDIAIGLPRDGHTYFGGVEHPGEPGPAYILDSVVTTLSVSDPSRISQVTWKLDGATIGTSASAPWSVPLRAEEFWPGLYVLRAQLQDVDPRCAYDVSRTVRIGEPTQHAIARGAHVALAQPVELQARTQGASGGATAVTHVFEETGIPVKTGTIVESTDFRKDGTGFGSHALAVLENVTILDGRVFIEALHAEADAFFDPATGEPRLSSGGSAVGSVWVDGTRVPVAGLNTPLDVPGVGRLVFLEVQETEAADHAEIRVIGVHAYFAHDGLRGEAALAQAVAGVDTLPAPFGGEMHLLDPQDDAGTSGDASGTRDAATPLDVRAAPDAPGARIFGGRVTPDDYADWYAFPVKIGEKVAVTVKPAERTHVRTESVGETPTLGEFTFERLEVPDLDVLLVSPSGAALRSDLPLSSPERIELNVDEEGVWRVGVLGDGVDSNYTMEVSVSPVAFLPEVPHAASCGAADAPFVGEGIATVFPADERRHFYRTTATIGQDLVVSLTPTDPDGADFDVYLYDRDCGYLTESALGKSLLFPGDMPKGVADVMFELPSTYTGEYFIEVRRHVGVGNYVLQARAAEAIPTLPLNDALTGADASDDPATPTPLPADQGVFEGNFTETDRADAYSFQAQAGETLALNVAAAGGTQIHVWLFSPSGMAIWSDFSATSGDATYLSTLTETGAYTLLVLLDHGGGNYLVTVAHAPVPNVV